MSTADSTLVIDAETAKGVRELVKLAQTQETVEKGNKRLGQTFKTTQRSSEQMGQSIVSLNRGLVGLAAGFISLSSAARVLQQIEQTMARLAQSSDKAAQGFLPFSVQMAGQPGAFDFIRRTRVQSASMGMTQAQGGELANIIKATQGADFAKDFPLAGRMVGALGVAPESAGSVIGNAILRGQDTDIAASRFLAAADLARVNPAQMARVVGKTTGYTSTEAGLAVATALSPAVEAEQLPAAVEAVSRLFMKDESKLAKKFKLQGLDERQRLDVLAGAMGDTGDETKFIRSIAEKYDIGEEEGRGIRALLMGRGLMSQNLATIQGVGAGGIESRYLNMRSDDPMFRAEFDARRARELSSLGGTIGPIGDLSGATRAIDQSIALRLQTAAPRLAPFLVDQDTGQVGNMGRFLFGETMIEENKARGQTHGRGLETEIDKLIQALLENTNATRENSGSSTPARNANL